MSIMCLIMIVFLCVLYIMNYHDNELQYNDNDNDKNDNDNYNT